MARMRDGYGHSTHSRRLSSRFSVKVTLGGRAGKIVIDRATACVEREMRRRLSIDRVSSPGLVSGVIPVAPNPPEQGERRRIG
jgi:hypothetical protein